MIQYVLQIRESDGWLAKTFKVNSAPIPPVVPAGRIQVVMTNDDSYNEIVAAYAQYELTIAFSYDDVQETVSCSGAYSHTWDIN